MKYRRSVQCPILATVAEDCSRLAYHRHAELAFIKQMNNPKAPTGFFRNWQ
jgi:hypothetical protein